MTDLARLLGVALAGAAVNTIVTRSTIFRKLREWLDARSTFLGDLVYCPLCFGTWTGLLLAAVLDLRLFGGPAVVDWFFSALAATTLIVPFTYLVWFCWTNTLVKPKHDE